MDPRPPWPRSLESIWTLEHDDGAMVSVFVFECEGRAAARAVLLKSLGQFQARLERRDGPGEVAFGLKAKQTVLLFAAANIVAVVRNAGPEVIPITTVARELERHILERPDGQGRGAARDHAVRGRGGRFRRRVGSTARDRSARPARATPVVQALREPRRGPRGGRTACLPPHRSRPVRDHALRDQREGGAASRTVRIGTR